MGAELQGGHLRASWVYCNVSCIKADRGGCLRGVYQENIHSSAYICGRPIFGLKPPEMAQGRLVAKVEIACHMMHIRSETPTTEKS